MKTKSKLLSFFVVASLLLCEAKAAWTEAYLPYDPRTGAFGFSRSFSSQRLDTTMVVGGHRMRAKVYVTDLSHVQDRYGIMIWVSDPDASVYIARLGGRGRRECSDWINLEVLEVTSDYKIVDAMDSTLERVAIVVTSPHRNRPFSIIIMAICE